MTENDRRLAEDAKRAAEASKSVTSLAEKADNIKSRIALITKLGRLEDASKLEAQLLDVLEAEFNLKWGVQETNLAASTLDFTTRAVLAQQSSAPSQTH